MALRSREISIHGISGSVYTFEKAGDLFPVHTHRNEAENHITVVTFGSIRCLGHPKHHGKILAATPGGTIVNWVPGEPHGFEALEDGTTIFNIRKRL